MAMTGVEVIEELRGLLREPQTDAQKPWHYPTEDLAVQLRSALRHLRVADALGGDVDLEIDADGTFSDDVEDTTGLMLANFAAERLIAGDLTQKLLDGELGVYFRTGTDIIDTKTAASSFEKAATRCKEQFESLLAIALAGLNGGTESVFGGQVPLTDGEGASA